MVINGENMRKVIRFHVSILLVIIGSIWHVEGLRTRNVMRKIGPTRLIPLKSRLRKLDEMLVVSCGTGTLVTLLAYFFSLPKGSLQGTNERKLLHHLLDGYQILERPVANESDPLQLSFGLTLMQIIDVDEKNQILITNTWLNLDEKNQQLVTMTWLNLNWNDANLRWNSSDYGNITNLRIPPHRIWKPDVLMYNSADEGFDGTYQTNVVVLNNGSCNYIPPGIFKSTCKIDITWFPFDEQKCEMKFGSWTYDGFQLDLQLAEESGGDTSGFIKNGEWDLKGVPGKRNENFYVCCPEPYVDITFVINIQRRTLYYFFNLIVPCVLIASMAVLGFTLPPDSGEKLSLGVPGVRNVKFYACCPEPYIDITFYIHIRRRTLFYLVNLLLPGVMVSSMTLLGFTLPHECGEKLTLGVTILLSLTVFLNMVAETMPATSDAVPLLGVTILLSLTVFHNLVAETLPQVSDALPVLGTYFNCIMFMVASSVVSTILILNYHHRSADTHEMSPWIRVVFLQWLPWLLRMSRPGDKITLKTLSATAKMRDQIRELEMKERSSKSLLANVLDMDDDFRPATMRTPHSTPGWRIGGSHEDPIASTVSHNPCVGSHRELGLILKELRFITEKIRKDDEAADIKNEWKFAAMVVDRLCLIVFTLFTIIATVAVLASAPQVFVP